MVSLQSRFLPASPAGPWELAAFLMVAGSVALVNLSIAASQVLLAGAVLAAIYLWRRDGLRPGLPAGLLWAMLSLFLWSLAAMAASSGSPRDAFVRKFILFTLLLIVPTLARGAEKLLWIYHAVFAVAAVSAGVGLIQFLAQPDRSLLDRIKGFMSIWMTFSGLLMLVLVALAAYLAVFGWRRHRWTIPLGLLLAGVLILSKTRNAWLGAVLGIAAVLALRRPRALLLLAALLPVLYFAAPANIRQRLQSGWNPEDPNTRNRIELIGTGLRLVRAHPWFGVGQKVSLVAPAYRGSTEFPDWMYLHLHNNLLQIAAERGIPGLAIWLWFMAQLGWKALRTARSRGRPGDSGAGGGGDVAVFAGLAAAGGWVALMAAGLFEYNFGDSEVLTLFLFMAAAPYAVSVPPHPKDLQAPGSGR